MTTSFVATVIIVLSPDPPSTLEEGPGNETNSDHYCIFLSLFFSPPSLFLPPFLSLFLLLLHPPSLSSLSPTSDACTQFLIDIGVELIILYEHIYEIYGDIQGARNSFDISAYEQG